MKVPAQVKSKGRGAIAKGETHMTTIDETRLTPEAREHYDRMIKAEKKAGDETVYEGHEPVIIILD